MAQHSPTSLYSDVIPIEREYFDLFFFSALKSYNGASDSRIGPPLATSIRTARAHAGCRAKWINRDSFRYSGREWSGRLQWVHQSTGQVVKFEARFVNGFTKIEVD